jgi:protein CpxP
MKILNLLYDCLSYRYNLNTLLMKTWILAAVMIISLNATAQQRGEKRVQLKPEQRVELQAKKMTLALNLNEKQQKEVQKLLLERSKKAEQFRAQHQADKAAGKNPTADELFAAKSRQLDERIATQAEMKKILTAEQFEKWQEIKKDRHSRLKKRHKGLREHRG